MYVSKIFLYAEKIFKYTEKISKYVVTTIPKVTKSNYRISSFNVSWGLYLRFYLKSIEIKQNYDETLLGTFRR